MRISVILLMLLGWSVLACRDFASAAGEADAIRERHGFERVAVHVHYQNGRLTLRLVARDDRFAELPLDSLRTIAQQLAGELREGRFGSADIVEVGLGNQPRWRPFRREARTTYSFTFPEPPVTESNTPAPAR